MSPSISVPFSSTARHLSPSPSYAIPRLYFPSTTFSFSFSKCVDPHPSFILIPFGLLFMISKFIPKRLYIFSATLYVAPFAVSISTLKSSFLFFVIFLTELIF